MSVVGAIASLDPREWTVTRTETGAYDASGWYVPGTSSSTFEIVASIQEMTGKVLRDLPEGQRTDETKVVYTETELRSRAPAYDSIPAVEPDRIMFEGTLWPVISVKKYDAFGGKFWRAIIARKEIP